MKGMVEYADKAAEPHSRLKYYFNDVVVLCICNGPEVVCVTLIKRLHGATATGHLLSVKLYLHWNTGWVSIALRFLGGKSDGNATVQKREPDQIHKKCFYTCLRCFFD